MNETPTEPKAETETLGTALPKEIERVQELMALYREIGPAGAFALTMMQNDIRLASRAMIEGDLLVMIRVYKSLKEYTA